MSGQVAEEIGLIRLGSRVESFDQSYLLPWKLYLVMQSRAMHGRLILLSLLKQPNSFATVNESDVDCSKVMC